MDLKVEVSVKGCLDRKVNNKVKVILKVRCASRFRSVQKYWVLGLQGLNQSTNKGCSIVARSFIQMAKVPFSFDYSKNEM